MNISVCARVNSGVFVGLCVCGCVYMCECVCRCVTVCLCVWRACVSVCVAVYMCSLCVGVYVCQGSMCSCVQTIPTNYHFICEEITNTSLNTYLEQATKAKLSYRKRNNKETGEKTAALRVGTLT